MQTPIINAVRGRSRQAMSMALGAASNVASAGMGKVRAYGLWYDRPRILNLGVSSTLASAGQEGRSRYF